ncbi:MAG: sarcosine oxidase subunit gamma family protein [Gammaproteobacteria bacterium]
MPEHPGFNLRQIEDRSMVRLRIRPKAVAVACDALQLPQQALHWRDEDPVVHWLGPDQWLFTSDTKPANEIILFIDDALSGQLHAATDMSSANVCFALKGPAARTILAMGCGIDVHPDAFSTGQCVRTHFAKVVLLIAAIGDNHFNLYADRSHTRYLGEWIANAGEDPITRQSQDHIPEVSHR